MAADFYIKGVEPKKIYDYIDTFHEGGLGLYSDFVHCDMRAKKARWGNDK
jgi:uncharacterized protein YcbK (DUF882 family)